MITRVSFFVCLLCMALVNAKSNRIVGGDRATPGQFKYQVSVQADYEHQCGGAIISDQHVLTVGHCVVDSGNFIQMNYQVVAGSTNVLRDEGVRIDVDKIYVPMKFLAIDSSYDIAVLKLHRTFGLDCNPNLQPINLPSSRESPHTGETAVLAGYGLIYVEVMINPKTGEEIEVNGRRDGKLKYARIKIIGNTECTRNNVLQKIGRNLFCGQTVQRGEDPEGICGGDSGSPLAIGNTIIGIANQSPLGCNEQNAFAIYTRVSTFLGFITKAMKDAKSTLIAVHEIHRDESSSGDGRAESSKRHEQSIKRFIG